MNKTFAALAVSAFALMGCDSGTANAQNPSAMPAMSAEMQQQHDNMQKEIKQIRDQPVSYTHLRAHETDSYLVCRLLLEKKKKQKAGTWI